MWQAQNHQQKQLLWKRAQGWQMPHLALRETWKANLKTGTAVVGWGTLVTTRQSQRSCERSRCPQRASGAHPQQWGLWENQCVDAFQGFFSEFSTKKTQSFEPTSIRVSVHFNKDVFSTAVDALNWNFISIVLLCEELTSAWIITRLISTVWRVPIPSWALV